MQDVHGTTWSGRKVLESWWQRWQKSEQSQQHYLQLICLHWQYPVRECFGAVIERISVIPGSVRFSLSLLSRGRFPVLLFPTPWTCWDRRAGSCRVPRWRSPPCTRPHLPCPLQRGWHQCSTKPPRGWLLPSQQPPHSHRHRSRPRDKLRPRRRALFPRPRRPRARPRGRLQPRPRWHRSHRPLPSPSLCQPHSQPSSSQHLCRHSHLALQ